MKTSKQQVIFLGVLVLAAVVALPASASADCPGGDAYPDLAERDELVELLRVTEFEAADAATELKRAGYKKTEKEMKGLTKLAKEGVRDLRYASCQDIDHLKQDLVDRMERVEDRADYEGVPAAILLPVQEALDAFVESPRPVVVGDRQVFTCHGGWPGARRCVYRFASPTDIVPDSVRAQVLGHWGVHWFVAYPSAPRIITLEAQVAEGDMFNPNKHRTVFEVLWDRFE